MRRTAMMKLAAGLVVAGLAAGCGTQAPGGGNGSHWNAAALTKCVHPRRGSERTTITLTNSANRKVMCLLPGVGVFVALHGTPKDLWTAVTSSSPALQARPNGALSLPVGVTGAFFVATAPGTAKLTSTLRPCRPSPRSHPVAHCLRLIRFAVTIKVPR